MKTLRVKIPRKVSKRKARNVATQATNKAKHETSFINHWKMLAGQLTEPEREHRFHEVRKWRFDFAWPSAKLAVELHGGGNRGRHASVTGMAADLEKHNAATRLGWRVLAFNVVKLRDMPGVVAEVADMLRYLER